MSDDVFNLMGRAFALKYDEVDMLKERLAEAESLLQEAVGRYPVEENKDLWTSRVRAWLEK